MAREPQSAGDIVTRLAELGEEQDEVTVKTIMHAFGARTFGPAIMIPALLELTPIGAIPGMPTALAAIIVLIAAQKMLGRRALWLPGFIANRSLSGKKLVKASDKLEGIAAFMDRHFHRRWTFMTRTPFSQIAAGAVILLCLTVPFLEVVPFASSGPMLAIAAFGLAVLVRDGVLMAVALAIIAGVMTVLGVDYSDGYLSDTDAADGLITEEMLEGDDYREPETLEEAAGTRNRSDQR